MKITSLNVAGYKKWSEREDSILEYLNNTQSDMVFFQEVKFNPEISLLNEASLVNSRLNVPYEYKQTAITRIYISSDGEQSREGLSVLSRYPIIDSEILVLHKRDDDKHTRIVQNVDVLVDGIVQKFSNVHFSNNNYSDEQLEEVLKITKGRREERIIVGDFNIFNIDAVDQLFIDEYTVSTSVSKYISFPSENVTLDYVLIPKSYEFRSLSIGENLSDHNALTFEI